MLDFVTLGLAFVAISVIAVLYLYLYTGSRNNRVSTVPGPDPSNVTEGNFPDIAKAGSLHEYLVELHREYGDIVGFWWGQEFVVSIASPELFKEHNTLFDRPPMLFKMFEEFITPHSIQYANGVDGQSRRHAYDKSMSHESCFAMMPTLLEVSEDFVEKLENLAEGEHIPVAEYTFALVIKTASLCLFDDYFKDFDQLVRFKDAYDIVWGDLELRLTAGDPEEGSSRYQRYHKAETFLKSEIRKIIKSRRADPLKDSTLHHFLDTILNYDCSEDQKVADALSYFVGSTHTSGNHLTWCLYYLASYPEVQEKLYSVLIDELGTSDDVTAQAVTSVKYLRQVVDETLRCAVVGPWAARFQQDCDTELGGHVIPKGTSVIHALGVVLQDERIWESPKVFDPERFANDKKVKPHSFEPFGFGGKRKCPGYRFAYLEISVFLAIILRKYKFHLVEGQVVTAVHGLVTHPADEIWMTITKRT